MNKEEFLLDTLQYYTVAPNERRSVKLTEGGLQDGCYYEPLLKTSTGCAIGRHLTPEAQKQFDKIGSITSVYDALEEQTPGRIKELLPTWMLELGIGYLQQIQFLHDDSKSWYKTGLTLRGKTEVGRLVDEYELDRSKFKAFLN